MTFGDASKEVGVTIGDEGGENAVGLGGNVMVEVPEADLECVGLPVLVDVGDLGTVLGILGDLPMLRTRSRKVGLS